MEVKMGLRTRPTVPAGTDALPLRNQVTDGDRAASLRKVDVGGDGPVRMADVYVILLARHASPVGEPILDQ
jgi:hypothetical protein